MTICEKALLLGSVRITYTSCSSTLICCFLFIFFFRQDHTLISIGFLNSFVCNQPTQVSMAALDVLLDWLLLQKKPVLSRNYTIQGHCQVTSRFPLSPGQGMMHDLQHWEHYVCYYYYHFLPSHLLLLLLPCISSSSSSAAAAATAGAAEPTSDQQ